MKHLKEKINNAFAAASRKYDPAVHDYIPLSATTLFAVELVKEFAGKSRQKPQP